MTRERTPEALMRAALELIATGCAHYRGGYCGERNGDKVLNLWWWADAWCDPCIARAALGNDWPVVENDNEWGYVDPSGTTWIVGEEMARRHVADGGGALVRKTADGRLVAQRQRVRS